MDRSLFPEGVEVHQVDLAREATERSEHILRRFVDGSETGIVSGFAVTLNSSTTLTVAAGTGYAPNGEFIEIANAQNLGRTAGVLTWICAVYSEVEGLSGTHVTLGTFLTRNKVRSATLATYSDTEYQALDSSNLLVLAKVSTANVLEEPASYQRTMTVNRTPYSSATTIVGVTITAVSVTHTTLGAGTLKYDGSTTDNTAPNNANPVPALKYTAPGDTEGQTAGDWTDISTVAPETLVTLVSSGASSASITVTVNRDFLVVNTSSRTEALTIGALYEELSPLSAKDGHHRDMVGTQAASRTNPHGLSIADLVPHYASFLAGIEVGAIENPGDPSSALRPRIVANSAYRDSGHAYAKTLIHKFKGAEGTIRTYITAAGALEIVTNALWGHNFNAATNTQGYDADWIKEHSSSRATKWVLGPLSGGAEATIAQYYVDANEGATFRDTVWKEVSLAGSSTNILRLGQGILSTAAEAATPRISMTASSTHRTLLIESAYANNRTLRLYVSGGGNGYLELTINAEWDNGNSNWIRSSSDSSMYRFKNGQLCLMYRGSSESQPWADSAWANKGEWNFSGADGLSVSGPIKPVAAPATPVPNALYADNIAKAYGTVSYTTGAVAMVAGSDFGVVSVTSGQPGGSGTAYMEVTLDNPMTTSTYPVMLTHHGASSRIAMIKAATTNTFQIALYDLPNHQFYASFSSVTGSISFVVHGRQA